MMRENERTLKARLNDGEVLLGTFYKLDSLQMAELLALAGFDFIIVDGEHSNFSYREMQNVVRAANSMGMDAVVRVPSAKEEHILHAGDMGAQGIQIPGLESARAAEEAVRQMRYAPKGVRGFSMTSRAARYTFCPKDQYTQYVNETLLSVVMVENREIVEQVPQLCENPDIDVLFVGTGDLSQSLGVFGQTSHPAVLDAVQRTATYARSAGKHFGIIANDFEDARRYCKMGAQYIALATDITLIAKMLRYVRGQFDGILADN